MSSTSDASSSDITFEDNDSVLNASHNTLPLAAVAIPLCAAQLLGARHMRGQVMKLLRDPHVWLPWRNKSPWKNPTHSWWWNAKPWLNQEVIPNNGFARNFSSDHESRFAAVEKPETVASEPKQEILLSHFEDAVLLYGRLHRHIFCVRINSFCEPRSGVFAICLRSLILFAILPDFLCNQATAIS